MKLIKYIKKVVDIKTNASRHAVSGEIITDKDVYNPYFVLKSYFEPRFIDKYGLESEELLRHGTGYVDCLDIHGKIHRLQYYEYAIIIYSKRLESNFRKRFPQLNGELEYEVGKYIETINENIEIY